MSTTTASFDHGLDWEASFGYTQGLRVGDTLYISGQLAHDRHGDLVGADDIDAQTRKAFENLDAVLRGFGATRSQVVETTVLIVGLHEHFAAVSRAHSDFFGDHRPASTAMGVVELALPDQLFEVAAIARLDAPA